MHLRAKAIKVRKIYAASFSILEKLEVGFFQNIKTPTRDAICFGFSRQAAIFWKATN